MGYSGCYAGGIPALNTNEDVEKYLETIKVNFEYKRNLEQKLRKRIEELEDKHYKDKRLQEMKEQFETARADVRRGFPISEKESKAIAAWKKKHDTNEHGNPNQYHGASGGGYSYEFYPTGLGTFSRCVCSSCSNRAFKEAEGDMRKYENLLKQYKGVFEFDDV